MKATHCSRLTLHSQKKNVLEEIQFSRVFMCARIKKPEDNKSEKFIRFQFSVKGENETAKLTGDSRAEILLSIPIETIFQRGIFQNDFSFT